METLICNLLVVVLLLPYHLLPYTYLPLIQTLLVHFTRKYIGVYVQSGKSDSVHVFQYAYIHTQILCMCVCIVGSPYFEKILVGGKRLKNLNMYRVSSSYLCPMLSSVSCITAGMYILYVYSMCTTLCT